MSSKKTIQVPEPVPGTCYGCGCTDDRACLARHEDDEPCHWSNPQHTLCSMCVKINNRVDIMQMKGWY